MLDAAAAAEVALAAVVAVAAAAELALVVVAAAALPDAAAAVELVSPDVTDAHRLLTVSYHVGTSVLQSDLRRVRTGFFRIQTLEN